MNFDTCSTRETTYPCSIFEDRHPSTVSMTVLVVVEMFNALNNLSENQSLLWVVLFSSLVFNWETQGGKRKKKGKIALNFFLTLLNFRVIPPWSNLWLVASIILTMLLHILILYVPLLSALFSVSCFLLLWFTLIYNSLLLSFFFFEEIYLMAWDILFHRLHHCLGMSGLLSCIFLSL